MPIGLNWVIHKAILKIYIISNLHIICLILILLIKIL